MRTHFKILRVLVPLLAFSLAGCEGCGTSGPVAVVPNTAPQIRITQPDAPEEGDVLVPDGESLPFTAQVSDSEDDFEDLSVRWTGTRIDAVADPIDIGELAPDSTGFVQTSVGGLDPGVYQISAKVTDSDGASAEASVTVEFLGANVIPSVVITQPLDNAQVLQGSLVTFAATVSDDRGASQIDVEWFSSVDGLLDVTPPSAGGLLTFSRQNLTVGEHTVTLTATDADGGEASDSVNFTIYAENLPPFDPVVEIQPSDPLTADNLQCVITQGSADPEGEPITYTYRWYRNSSNTSITVSTVTAAQTDRLDEWTCEVVASDGLLLSNPATDTVVVANSVPSMTSATLGPSPAYESTVLVCTGAGFADDDGDAAGFVATWYVNGSPVPGVTDLQLDGQWFERTDEVWCELAPFDGVDVGASVTSNSITIQNTPPTDPVVEVDPSPSAAVDDAIACIVDVESTDADGDAILNPGGYEIEWWRNGVLDTASAGLWILPSARTFLGDEWICRVRATDGVDWSAWAEASTEVLPSVGDLVLTEFLADPEAVPDVAGEWIEIFNAANYTIDLLGFELRDDGVDSHIIAASLPLPAGARAVLGRNADYSTNGGAIVAYEYSNFALSDTSDSIVIAFEGVEIDRFNYDLTGFTNMGGHALAFNEATGIPSASGNDSMTVWCPAGTPFVGPLSDFGTPGGTNNGCACFASDSDGDGYGDDASCGFPDCNDGDANVNPSATDVCENGQDENCDGLDAFCVCIDTDGDGDGYGDGALCSPADCNDSNPAINPGAPEICDGIDQDCSGVADDGVTLDMCPLTTQAAATTCLGGDCTVQTCNGDFFDVNTNYPDGCECEDDVFGGPTCGTAGDLGPMAPGGNETVSGRLPSSASQDWIQVSFPAGSGRPGGGTPEIEFLARPDSTYVFDVYYACGAPNAPCGSGGTAQGRDHWSFVDDQSFGTNAWNSNTVDWPNVVYLRVRRGGTAITCAEYELRIRR